MIEKIAVICVDNPRECDSFYDWLERNRQHIIGISENRGCGCCVDMFEIVLDDQAEVMPCEASGKFDSKSVRYGDERDQVLSELLNEVR